MRPKHLDQDVPFLKAVHVELRETKAKVRQTIQAICPSEEARPRGRIKYIGSREKPLEKRGLNQKLEVGLRGQFSGSGGMKRGKEGERTVNGTASSLSHYNSYEG